MEKKTQLRNLLLGGIVPIVIFTVLESYYGTLVGLIAAMVFGIGEIAFEYIREKKVSAITIGANSLILILGAISLFSQEGIWFKLQPAIMEAVFAALLVGSFLMKRPFLVLMAEKQNLWANVPPQVRPILEKRFGGLTFRLGIFFALHAGLATWAAFYWSTAAWAILKGVGFTASMVVYLLIEMVLLRKRALKKS